MITRQQRHTKGHTCIICGGADSDRRGQGRRCWGFESDSDIYIYCEQIEAPGHWNAKVQAWEHRRHGPCPCGQTDHEIGPTTGLSSHRQQPAVEETPTPPANLHLIFEREMELCSLKAEHREHLAARGAADLQAAERFGYGSLSHEGAEADQALTTLINEFGADAIERMPGVWKRRDGRLAMHAATDRYDAILIPCRDELGHIYAIVRMTVRDLDQKHGKYEAFQHSRQVFTIVGSFRRSSRHEIRVIEGCHKAHVAAVLDPGAIYIGLQGTSLHDHAMEAIAAKVPDVVIEMFDADKASNPNVAAAAAAIHRRLTDAEFRTEAAEWDAADGNGIDDVLASEGRIRFRSLDGGPTNQDGSSTSDDDGDSFAWCDSCAPHGGRLARERTYYRTECTRARTRIIELEARVSLVSAVMRNGKLKERYTGVAVVSLVSSVQSQGKDEDGWVHVKLGGSRPPTDPEPDRPPENSLAYLTGLSPHQVKRDLVRLADTRSG